MTFLHNLIFKPSKVLFKTTERLESKSIEIQFVLKNQILLGT